MKFYIIIFGITFSILLNNCKSGNSQNNDTTLSAKAFSDKIKALPNAPIVDVRTPDEFSKGHLVNAKNIDWNSNDFSQEISTLDKSKPIFVYCLSGGRSSSAANQMRSEGFTQVYELDGGIMKWRVDNLPETTESQAPKVAGMSKTKFEEELNSDKLVLVDFYADWCGPCQKMKPFLDEISKENTDKVVVLRINADDNQELCKKLKISTLPTLSLYKNKKMVWSKTGFINKQNILVALKEK
ncbi:MAG: thioredoxin domain-containing protein [Bacteroidota bacterium]